MHANENQAAISATKCSNSLFLRAQGPTGFVAMEGEGASCSSLYETWRTVPTTVGQHEQPVPTRSTSSSAFSCEPFEAYR